MKSILQVGKSIGENDYYQLKTDCLSSHISLANKKESDILGKSLTEGMPYEFVRRSGESVKVIYGVLRNLFFVKNKINLFIDSSIALSN